MGKIFIRLFSVALLAALAAACTTEPPKCSDPATISMVQRIFLTQLLPAEYKGIAAELFNGKTKIELAAPTKYDKDIKKLECSGTFVVDASAGVDQLGRDTLTNPKLLRELGFSSQVKHVPSEINNGKFAFNLNYYSQDVDGRHMAAVQGVDPFRAFLVGAYVAGHQNPAKQAQPSKEEKPEEIIESSKPPNCSSQEAIARLKEIILAKITFKEYAPPSKEEFDTAVTFVSPAPIGYEDEIQKYTCTGMLVVDMDFESEEYRKRLLTFDDYVSTSPRRGAFQQVLSGYEPSTKKLSSQIQYSSQNTDGRHTVKLFDIPQELNHVLGVFTKITP